MYLPVILQFFDEHSINCCQLIAIDILTLYDLSMQCLFNKKFLLTDKCPPLVSLVVAIYDLSSPHLIFSLFSFFTSIDYIF